MVYSEYEYYWVYLLFIKNAYWLPTAVDCVIVLSALLTSYPPLPTVVQETWYANLEQKPSVNKVIARK